MNELTNTVATETANVAQQVIPAGYEVVESTGMSGLVKNLIAGTAMAGAGVGAFFAGRHFGKKKAAEEFEEQMAEYEERLSAIEGVLSGEYYQEEEPTDTTETKPEKVEGEVENK